MARYKSMAVDRGARLCSLRCAQCEVQGAKAQVAVRLEWAHAQLFGQGEGLQVVGFGLVCLRRLTMRCDRAEGARIRMPHALAA